MTLSAPPREMNVVVCGAGVAGIAVAHALAVRHGVKRVLLVSEHPPLALTSDKSTEAYRNWWPGPDDLMVRLMNRSIDLLEQWATESDNRFLLNRRGYLYCTTRPERAAAFEAEAALASSQGAGAVRTYRTVASTAAYQPSAVQGWRDHPTGADLFLGEDVVRAQFPWMAPGMCGVLHARRCGWFSGQQLGMWLLEQARAAGVELLEARVREVVTQGGAVHAVVCESAQGITHTVHTPVFVNAAGPHAKAVGALAGQQLPLFSEAHWKIALEDVHGAVPRDTGLVILDDPLSLAWSDDERAELAASAETRWLAEPFPAGIHLRPEGYGASRTVLMLWDYHRHERFDPPVFPMREDALYPEVVLRGMTQLVPALAPYVDRLPHAYVDGGYYTKTIENRPLVGAAGAPGAYVCAGLSGYGLMAAPACAELVAADVVAGRAARAEAADAADAWAGLRVARYDDPAYVARLAAWGATGQL